MNKILIIVDYQTEFVTGKFGFWQAQKIESSIAKKIFKYRKENSTIAFTLDTHNDKSLYKFSGSSYPAQQCIGKENKWHLYGMIDGLCQENDICFIKSTFGSRELFKFLDGKSFNTIELAGVSADVCILANAVIAKTCCPCAEIIVDKNCIASSDEKLFVNALTIMENMKITVK